MTDSGDFAWCNFSTEILEVGIVWGDGMNVCRPLAHYLYGIEYICTNNIRFPFEKAFSKQQVKAI